MELFFAMDEIIDCPLIITNAVIDAVMDSIGINVSLSIGSYSSKCGCSYICTQRSMLQIPKPST